MRDGKGGRSPHSFRTAGIHDCIKESIMEPGSRPANFVGVNRFARRIVSFGMTLVVAMTMAISARAQTPVTPSGSGTAGDPYQISELGNLVWMKQNASTSSGKYYKLMNDIDASATAGWNAGAGFEPIGSFFYGNFDGNGKVIQNLTVNRPTTILVGLFGSMQGEVKDLRVSQCSMRGSSWVGGVAGWAMDVVTNCYASGTIMGKENVGGIAGVNSLLMVQCHADCTVTGTNKVGGLVGYNSDAEIRRCYATGVVTGKTEVGGFVGLNSGNGSVAECYATGSVMGDQGVGGLVGYNYQDGVISNCYAMGSVVGVAGVGGLVGANHGDSDSTATVTRCYAIGSVQGSSFVGGLVGDTADGGTVNNSYWDTNTSVRTTSDGGTGKTTAEMQQQATFADWDFVNVWRIEENATYPSFLWQPWARMDGANFGMGTNGFGFTIIGTGAQFTVMAATNLMDAVWMAAGTGTLASGVYYFSDPQWMNHPSHFYQLRAP
jgi:hypothetical protein